ncbi:uncharacterized protein TNIN_365711 [Trichonephila inaurata madagascariensis]|uniref:Ubiquitin-like protease family profile domain-containing protein n=1 Tax=Trichonephila inaurata madagascariensis TaxID=2747483 RepID=A0A8X7C2T1_9ARAC|nr:uncharacterized protein TNIN_365711 [Trichonephila inaurata madagascariensis]
MTTILRNLGTLASSRLGVAMSGIEVSSYLSFCSVTRPIFRGVYAANCIPDIRKYKRAAIVVNTDVSTGPGVHWLALFYENGKLEFFDSFGRPPQYFGLHIIKYLQKYQNVDIVSIPLQNPCSSVCGPYCIYYILKRSLGCSKMTIQNHLLTIENNLDRDHYVDEYLRNNILTSNAPGNIG